jgi:hypothetical protein
MASDDDDPRAPYKVYEGNELKGTYATRAEARRAQQRLAESESQCNFRVKTGKSRSEQLFSDLPSEVDLTADIVDVSQVPSNGLMHAAISCAMTRSSSARWPRSC